MAGLVLFVGGFTFIGNAALERTLSNNYDLRWEHFGNPGELYAVSAFYKDFKNPIERVILTVNGEVQFQNVEAAQVAGVDLQEPTATKATTTSPASTARAARSRFCSVTTAEFQASAKLRTVRYATDGTPRPLSGERLGCPVVG